MCNMNSIFIYCFTVSEKPFSDLKSKSEQKAKSYYLSCMDVNETIEALGAQPMLDLLDQVLLKILVNLIYVRV